MGDTNKENNTYHHVVYSVKGGCGKTTFSLRLLLTDFFRKEKIGSGAAGDKDKKEKAEISYMFDMDFLGTSLHRLLNPGDELGNKPADGSEDKSEYIFMNDIIFNDADVLDIEEGGNSLELGGMKDGDAKYIIPSSSREKDKERFHVKRRNTPLLRYDEFRHEMEGIISKIKLFELSKNLTERKGLPYDINFIYDMPPNSDGYTEALFDYLFELVEKGEKVFLYLVFNNDATLSCDVEWLENFVSSGRMTDGVAVYFVKSEILNEKERGALGLEEIDAPSVKKMIDEHHIDGDMAGFITSPYETNVVRFNYGAAKPGGKEIKLEELFENSILMERGG